MRIAILNVRYSSNLGDGAIAECLELALQKFGRVSSVHSVDLAGRTEYGGGTGRLRRIVMPVLDRMPRPMRHAATQQLLSIQINRARADWQSALSAVDGIVIGGGQLFADADLNFPRKIMAALDAAPAGVPFALFGVGVSRGWSPTGRRMFRRILTDRRLAAIYVRDGRSAGALVDQAGPLGVPVALTSDPALLAAAVYGPANARTGRPRIGLGLIHPAIQKLHAGGGVPGGATFFAEVAAALSEQGDVCLFTNGASEDEAVSAEVAALLAARGIAHEVCPAPRTPADLAAMIAGFDVLTAHRLHANIIGAALGVPTVGLVWEDKVAAFYEAMGAPDRALPAARQTAEVIAAAVATALDDRRPLPGRDDAIMRLERDTAALVEQLSGHQAA
jgi:polysaccharide pyruvyl transferase WcaK-like protein